MKHHSHHIERKRKLHALWFTIIGALFSAMVVAGMIYFTYSISPKRM